MIDTELLLDARRQIGATSPDAAVNEALRRLVAEGARQA
jgi:Arc/MetJ family transcription regulator